jgi:hypothetical protein
MIMDFPPRFVLSVALILAVPVVARADYGPTGRIGPSGAEVAGAIAGVAVGATLILYFVLRSPTITGCVQATDGSMALVNEKDKHAYPLVGNHLELKPGERLKLKGKKAKDKDRKPIFRVKNVDHDYGACKP